MRDPVRCIFQRNVVGGARLRRQIPKEDFNEEEGEAAPAVNGLQWMSVCRRCRWKRTC